MIVEVEDVEIDDGGKMYGAAMPATMSNLRRTLWRRMKMR